MSKLTYIPFASVDSIIDELKLDKSNDLSFIAILNYLKQHLLVESVIREHSYIDKDYADEFSNLYSKTFRYKDKGYCERFHFFKNSFKDINDFIDQFTCTNKLEYLGFLVKRPLEVGKVGRTIIIPGKLADFFYLSTIERNVHLLGKTIKVKGSPFIEQDCMVSTCAQSAIWIAAKYMHYNFSFPRSLPYNITNSANKFSVSGRALPSLGLTIEQMNASLVNLGFSPILYYKPKRRDYDTDEEYENEMLLWDPLNKIYPYVESKLPVILAFKKHVCTVIGHKIYKNTNLIDINRHIQEVQKTAEEEENIELKISLDGSPEFFPSFALSSVFVDALIVNDDQFGIYRLLPINDDNHNQLKNDYPELMPSEKHSYKNLIDYVEQIIIPLPDKIYLLAEDAIKITKKLMFSVKSNADLLMRLTDQANQGNKYANYLRSTLAPVGKDPMLFRVYFQTSSEFKGKVNSNKQINKKVKHYYLTMEMPRYIWVVEISSYNLYSEHKKIVGEILFDSTANKYDFYNSYISIHLPGVFVQNQTRGAETIPEKKIDNEEAYKTTYRDYNFTCEIIEGEL